MDSELSESTAMRIAGFLKLRRVRWALRRLHVPVDSKALVLEVGAGGNPYPRANVLLDGFEESTERQEERLVKDRPFVVGLCERLPFRDKVFDFVIASHVLEHTDDPSAFLSELQRVAKAGYIETPDGFFERINPYTYHRLEVTSKNNGLLIRKKPSWKVDPEIVEWYEAKLKKNSEFQRLLRVAPDPFYVRYYWSDSIDYVVTNDEDNASWEYPSEIKRPSQEVHSIKDTFRLAYLRVIRKVFSQNRRNSKIDLLSLLQCVMCNSGSLERAGEGIVCANCGQKYDLSNTVPHIVAKDLDGANRVRSRVEALK